MVAQVQAVFLLSWHFQGGPLPATPAELDRFFPPPPAGDGLELRAAPGESDGGCHDLSFDSAGGGQNNRRTTDHAMKLASYPA